MLDLLQSMVSHGLLGDEQVINALLALLSFSSWMLDM